MKRILSLIIIGLLCFSLFSVFAPQASGTESLLWRDDFEGYMVGSFPSSGGWELVYSGKGTQYQIIATAASHSPTKALQLWGQNGWSANVQKRVTSSADVIGYEAYIRAESNTGPADHVAQIAFWDLQGAPWGKRFAVIQFDEDGNVYTAPLHLGPTFIVLGTYEATKWYKFRVVIDRTAGTYGVWIDDAPAAQDIAIADTYEIDALMLESGHAEVKTYFDDIQVFEGDLAHTCMGYWKFDEGSGTVAGDSSGNGNTGTLMNGPQWVDGVIGKALRFDGIDDYLSASDSPSLDVSGNQIAVMFWMRPAADIDASTPYQKLYDKGDAYHSAIGGGGMRFTIAYVHDIDSVRKTWSGGSWYHIAHVYDGSTISIYVNGVLDNSEPETGSIHVTSLPFTIAAYTFGGKWFFPGTIDEFRIYAYALKAEEIWNDYVSVNQPPVAEFTHSPTYPDIYEKVNFDASTSYDPDGGTIVSYEWDFGDGSSESDMITNHKYRSEGTYEVTLTVTDDEGQKGVASLDVVVVLRMYYELYLEIDYMEGHAPSDEVLTYIKEFFRTTSTRVLVHIIPPEEISLEEWHEIDSDERTTHAEFEAFESTYNHWGDDAGFSTYTSKYKWILFGAEWAANPYYNGLTHFDPDALWVQGRIAYAPAGNYIFIAHERINEFANENGLLPEEVETKTLMHELGHSIGIWMGIYHSDSNTYEEMYDNNPFSVMTRADPTVYTYNDEIDETYSPNYWRLKSMHFYEF